MDSSRDTLDKIKDSVNRGIATINVAASSTMEKARLKTHVDTLKHEIDKLYRECGQKVYENRMLENPDSSVVDKLCEDIKSKLDEIQKIKGEIEQIPERDNRIFGRETASREEKTKESEVVFCSKCGAKYKTKINFCTKCGEKL